MKGVEELTSKEKAMIFETEEQHLWWLGNNKDRLGLTWEEVANTLNKRWRKDETEYFTESAYRKKFTYAKEVFDAAIKPEVEKTMKDAGTYVDSIQAERERLYEEKVKVWDARRAYNKSMRDVARHTDTFSLLEEAIAAQGVERYPEITTTAASDGSTDLICCLSDIHYGIEFDSYTGKYNSVIAKTRIMQYAAELIKIGERHKSKNVYVAMLGDQISGNSHFSIAIENKENILEQIMGVSAIIGDFIYALAGYFDNVYINSVGGNHSRIQPKDMAVKDERLDNLIIWYLQAKFEHINKKVHVVPLKDNIDTTVAEIIVRGKEYIAVHGDYDPFTEAGMAKLVLWLGKKPYAILSGHMHTHTYRETSVVCIQSGSMCGSGDDYTVERRLRGRPSQAACVINDDGIEALYPVRFS